MRRGMKRGRSRDRAIAFLSVCVAAMALLATPAFAQDSDSDGVPDGQDRCSGGSGNHVREGKNGCPDFWSVTDVPQDIRFLAAGNFFPALTCEPAPCNAKGSLTVSERDRKTLRLRSRRIGAATHKQRRQSTIATYSDMNFKIPKKVSAAIKKRKSLNAVLAIQIDVPATDRADAVKFAFKEKIAFYKVALFRTRRYDPCKGGQHLLFSADNAAFIQQAFALVQVTQPPRCEDFAAFASTWHGPVR